MAGAESEQLAWEARFGRLAAMAAGLSALLFIASGIYLQFALQRRPGSSDQLLAQIRRESTDYLIAGVISALALVLLAVVLGYLYRATRARREQLPTAAIALTVFGVVGAAAIAIARPLDLLAAAGDLPPAALRNEEGVDAALGERTSLQIIGGIGLAANLALAFGTVLISVNAMRAGLLSRFLGVLGIVIGVLLPLVGAMPVLLFFWLGALAALFLNRWPGGRGPAWETGEAIPWPTMAQRNAEIDRRRAAADIGEEAEADADADRPESPAPSESATSSAPAASAESPSAGEDANGASPQSAGDGGPLAESRGKRKRGRRR